MKLTEEQKKKIKDNWGDWEIVHGEHDKLLEERVKKLDLEFYEDLQKQVEGATFWYA